VGLNRATILDFLLFVNKKTPEKGRGNHFPYAKNNCPFLHNISKKGQFDQLSER